MGMTDAFAPDAADFSGMDGTRELFISDLLHQASITVDEAGTEAAAATAAVVGVTSAMPPEDEPVEMTIDRPFVFMIRDTNTGAVLFVGRVVNPTG
jgi:serpin B